IVVIVAALLRSWLAKNTSSAKTPMVTRSSAKVKALTRSRCFESLLLSIALVSLERGKHFYRTTRASRRRRYSGPDNLDIGVRRGQRWRSRCGIHLRKCDAQHVPRLERRGRHGSDACC